MSGAFGWAGWCLEPVTMGPRSLSHPLTLALGTPAAGRWRTREKRVVCGIAYGGVGSITGPVCGSELPGNGPIWDGMVGMIATQCRSPRLGE